MTTRVELPNDGTSIWAGYKTFDLQIPGNRHRVVVEYRGEPPHGDSFHTMSIDGVAFPGYAWGNNFACAGDGRYLALSWMATRYERHTAVVDMTARRYFVLPDYIDNFTFRWPCIEGVGKSSSGLSFEFLGTEQWIDY